MIFLLLSFFAPSQCVSVESTPTSANLRYHLATLDQQQAKACDQRLVKPPSKSPPSSHDLEGYLEQPSSLTSWLDNHRHHQARMVGVNNNTTRCLHHQRLSSGAATAATTLRVAKCFEVPSANQANSMDFGNKLISFWCPSKVDTLLDQDQQRARHVTWWTKKSAWPSSSSGQDELGVYRANDGSTSSSTLPSLSSSSAQDRPGRINEKGRVANRRTSTKKANISPSKTSSFMIEDILSSN